ncbi:hypothetical protein D3C85_1752210 [compost metagenome]
MTVHRRRVNLPALTANFMNARVKRTARAEYRFGGQRAAHHRRGKQIFGFEQTAQRKRRGCLSAVQQRQPLFRGERNRL